MSDIVIATLDAGGNVPPALGIGAELSRRGHRVRMLSHEAQRIPAKSAGLEFVPYRHSPTWTPLRYKGFVASVRETGIFADREIGRDLLDLLARDAADLVIVDCMLLGVLDAAARSGLPHAALVHSFFGYYDGLWRRAPMGLRGTVKRIGPKRLWGDADLVLVCSDRELDPAGDRPSSPNVVWTGAVQNATAPAVDSVPPRVLASLSTIAYPGQSDVVQRILDAVADLDLDVVLTTGPSLDPTACRVPANASVHQYVPHDDLMPTCSAVIGHGGHATTMRALGYGLPVLLIPMHPMLDQPMVGTAVAAAGAGITLSRRASAEQIRTSLRTLLDRPEYRAGAERIGARLRGTDGAAVAADHLTALL